MRTPVNYYGLAYQPCFEIVGWIGSKHADNSLKEEINKQVVIFLIPVGIIA